MSVKLDFSKGAGYELVKIMAEGIPGSVNSKGRLLAEYIYMIAQLRMFCLGMKVKVNCKENSMRVALNYKLQQVIYVNRASVNEGLLVLV